MTSRWRGPTYGARRGIFALIVIVITIVGLAVAPAAADEHRFDESTDYTDEANFTVTLPETTDHYPGDHSVHSDSNGHNASIEYFAAGAQAMRDVDAEEGAFMDTIIIQAEFIDYSQCDDVQNTKVFGIDRGNTNSGTEIDEDLVQKRKSSTLTEGRLTVKFFEFEDFSNDPPYAAPEDAIVAAQGVGSNDGPCLKMTSEPGWYQVEGFINGTEADNGPNEEPSDDARKAGIRAFSNYIYICECDSEQAAREQLGPPPNEEPVNTDDNDATPTPTPTQTVEAVETATATQEAGDTSTATEEPSTPTPTEVPSTPTGTQVNVQGNDQQNEQGNDQQNEQQNDQQHNQQTNQAGGDGNQRIDRNTPTIGQGPGFTPPVTLLALLGAALLVCRRE